MAKNIEAIVDEPELDSPSAVKLAEQNALKNPLFQETLNSIKDPKERENFLKYFRMYLSQTYQNNPAIRRIMKSYDLSDKINYLPEEADDHRQMLSQQAYGEPGRTYHYINNFMGDKKTKKGMLERAYHATLGIAKETWPGIAALGGWYLGDKWYAKEKGKGTIGRGIDSASNIKLWPPWKTLPSLLGFIGKFAGKESFLKTMSLVRTPSLYLIGGYLLYKTLGYFIKKRRDKIDLEEIEKMERLRQGVGIQNQMLYHMAA